jgi:two-component system, OmpR family, response regulator
MKKTRILLVEDDATLLQVLKYNLEKEGYEVSTADDGVRALDAARKDKPDLIVLDVMLPGLDGFEVCRILRKETSMPILMLTAKADIVDKVVGLELGADDYITKPFNMRELIARIKAMLRRSEISDAAKLTQEPEIILSNGNLEIDTARHIVFKDKQPLELTLKEFELLAFLTKSKNQVFTRDYLLEHIWGYEYAGDSRTVDVHIRWLRQKIEDDPSHPNKLVTVRGVGYKFEG